MYFQQHINTPYVMELITNTQSHSQELAILLFSKTEEPKASYGVQLFFLLTMDLAVHRCRQVSAQQSAQLLKVMEGMVPNK